MRLTRTNLLTKMYYNTFPLYISFFRCLNVLEDLPTNNDDQRKGVNIVQYALRQPTMRIAENAGAGK